MPLNPNGKVDKPALPFPDTAEAAAALLSTSNLKTSTTSASEPTLTPTEQVISLIWGRLLPTPPTPHIPIDESFFDLGGHSILATRLIFELRKTFVVDAPLGLVFDKPTIKGLAKEIDMLRDPNFGLARAEESPSPTEASATAVGTGASTAVGSVTPSAGAAASGKGLPAPDDYAADFESLKSKLEPLYTSPTWSEGKVSNANVFLTGATGFLGAYILRDLLARLSSQVSRVFCLIRAKGPEDALERLRSSGKDRGVWDEEWVTSKRLKVLVGDLSEKRFGLKDEEWKEVEETADVVLHNGAMVKPPSPF